MNLIEAIILSAVVSGFLTTLVVKDSILEPWRARLASWAWKTRPDEETPGDGVKLATPRRVVLFVNNVIECHRCAGVWIAMPSTMLVLHRMPWTGGWDGLREFAVVFMGCSFVQFMVMRAGDAFSMIAEHRPTNTHYNTEVRYVETGKQEAG